MNNDKNTGNIYYSMEEILKEFLPENSHMESIERINNPYNLGFLMAKTNVKDIKHLIERQILIDSKEEAQE